MEYMEYITTNENTLIVSFKFKNKITGADTIFNYEVPFEVFIEAVKDYFDKHFDVVLDGKDKDIWNMLVDLGERVNADIIQEFIEDDEIIKELQDKLEEEAHEKFDELCQEEAEDEEDDKLDESYEDDEVTDDEISEALADYQWQITDSTTVGQYAQETADKLGCSKEQVLKVILNENPNIREDERMAKVAGLDDEEDEEARYKAIGDEEEFEDDELEESYSSSSLFESIVKKLRKEGYIVDVAEKINQVYQTYCYQMASARKRTPEDDPNYTGKMVEDDSYLDEQGLFGVFDHYDEIIDDIHGTEICVGEELFPADSRTVSGICREIKENIE